MTISGGTVTGGTAGAGSPVATGGTGFCTGIYLDQSAILTLKGTMSIGVPIDKYSLDATRTDGGVVVNTSDIVTITSTNTYAGGTTLIAGVLSINANLALGSSATAVNVAGSSTLQLTASIPDMARNMPISAAQTLTVDTNGFDLTNSGAISGAAGLLTKLGTGTLTLTSGTNSYGGGTTISMGTLALSGAGVLLSSGSVNINASTAVFDISSKTGMATIGNLSGVSSSTVTLGTNTLALGTIGSSTFNGNFSGAAGSSVIQQGTGTLTLGGVSPTNICGTYTCLQGETKLIGSLSVISQMQIDQGAILSGTGTLVGSLQLDGTISPGNSIGTFTIQGDATFSSTSTTEIEFSPTENDEIIITGELTIEPGASLLLHPDPGVYEFPIRRTIVDAASFAANYQYTNIINTFPLVKTSVIYDLSNADIILLLRLFRDVFPSGNLGQVAKCFDGFVQNPCGNMIYIVDVVASIPSMDGAADALNQLQPSLFTSLSVAQENNFFYVRDGIYAHLYDQRKGCQENSTPQKAVGLWVAGLGGFSSQSNEYREPGYKAYSPGALVGADANIGETGVLGGCAGYIYTDFQWHNSRGDADIQNIYGNIYGRWNPFSGYIQSNLSCGYGIYDVKRYLLFGPLDAIDTALKSHFQGWEGAVNLGGGWIYTADNIQFIPFANLDYMVIYQPHFQESGDSDLALSLERHFADLFTAEAGLDFKYCQKKLNYDLNLFMHASAISETRFYGASEKGSFACPCTMEVQGYYPSRVLFGMGLGIGINFQKNVLTTSFRGKYGNGFADTLVFAEYIRRF